MLRYFKRLIKRYQLWKVEREVLALERYGDKSNPKVLELIRNARQRIAEVRATSDQQ